MRNLNLNSLNTHDLDSKHGQTRLIQPKHICSLSSFSLHAFCCHSICLNWRFAIEVAEHWILNFDPKIVSNLWGELFCNKREFKAVEPLKDNLLSQKKQMQQWSERLVGIESHILLSIVTQQVSALADPAKSTNFESSGLRGNKKELDPVWAFKFQLHSTKNSTLHWFGRIALNWWLWLTFNCNTTYHSSRHTVESKSGASHKPNRAWSPPNTQKKVLELNFSWHKKVWNSTQQFRNCHSLEKHPWGRIELDCELNGARSQSST